MKLTAAPRMARTGAIVMMMVWGACLAPASRGSSVPYEELPIGYLPAQSVKATLRKTLSAQGCYVILPSTGTVRIYDDGAHVQAARLALETLQQAPANVSLEIRVITGLHRVARQSVPVGEPALDYEFPYPQNYAPSRIQNSYSGGPIIVVPAQPLNFTTRRVGPGNTVNVSPSGYRTLDSEVRIGETSLEGGVTRRLTGSAILGRPTILPVLANVPDVPSLRAWALAHRAISENEPPWSAARAELVVTPELSNGVLSLNVVPVIAACVEDRRQPPRRIPLAGCTTTVLIDRATGSAAVERMTGTDPEFYQVFFGAKEFSDDTLSSVSFTAGVRYLNQ
jgi:hypothetical protein